MLHLNVCRSRSLFRISDCISVLVQTVLVVVQLFKWTDGKPGGSPLLLPYVQISHRFWRPVLPVYTGHPVSIFPHLGFTACDFVTFASLISCSCFKSKVFYPLGSRYQYFPNRRGGVAGIGVPPTRRPAAQRPGGVGRHNWGQGHHLGTEWEGSDSRS